MKYKKNHVDGTCCACGYSGEEETRCTKIPDEGHCNHYYCGPEEECIREPESRSVE